jgi:hypothetical protein
MPQRGAKFFSAYDLPIPLEKLEQYLVRLILKPEFDAAFSQLGSFQIELEHPETADGIVLRRHNQS